ncbi:DNA-binding response regulator, OmpR family, contains REC and winged-helix (wHTH) domain [Proteiniborus ethanoligenes]|uniref:Stage 0 sporulation protein A homolog n=1 Tax=Proteiniborus ethanoligenes TaxID=415015 RepID=A0A1H3PV23_9FIRM|nr:response regulator transcription factor [Proteiniborus ethanoligenes]TAH62840.1 MAG: response regulator transcription factor [Gottschalkiaceae bacterium]SDZ04695.1 DNA-binding response regulator, OmpR family, contains REC and winged-helix (wHTH) domain [Proteiniborus ethanoligenes]
MHNTKNILVVDDEAQITEVIKAYLQKENYNVYTAHNGQDAMNIFNRESIDFIVLDLMLPDLSGEEICKRIRVKSTVPILMLTAKAEEEDRVTGLYLGADDYLVKPFSPKELVARIKAIFRRTEKDFIKAEIIEFKDGDLSVDINKMELYKKGVQRELTPTEFKLAATLMQNPSKVFSREELIEKVLGYDYEGYDRTIDTHIKNIRQKIEDENNKYIHTVYGVGYKFVGE